MSFQHQFTMMATVFVAVCAAGCTTTSMHSDHLAQHIGQEKVTGQSNAIGQNRQNGAESKSKPEAGQVRLVSGVDDDPAQKTEAGQLGEKSNEQPSEPLVKPAEQAGEQGNAIVPELLPQQETTLDLQTIRQSVLLQYPLLAVAERERIVTAGKQLAAFGEFDLKLKAESINQPLSFYKNYRQAVALEQADFRGGKGFVKYRIGDGFFEPWYGERETNEGGEFSAGYAFALARDRLIDGKRAKIQKAEIERRIVEPLIRSQMLQFTFEATVFYWDWVAAGQALEVQKQLLRLAEDRNSKIKRQVELGDLPNVELIDNERLIAGRRAKLLESERKFQATAIKLSLYNRNGSGLPVIPDETLLPADFPKLDDQQADLLEGSVTKAVVQRPELAIIDLDRASTEVDLAIAGNAFLPKIDGFVTVKKDVGGLASSKGDKEPTELIAGLVGELPIQRREAYGLRQAAQGKMSQIAIKRVFTIDKITAEVQDAISAMQLASQRIVQAARTVELAEQSEAVERRQFELGDSTLVLLNIREEATTVAKLNLIETKADYLKAVGQYENAVGNLPIDVSAVITTH